MQYVIEVDSEVDSVLNNNAKLRGLSVPALIEQMLCQYAVDAHIMEQEELWRDGIQSCADINLDWANL